jgi:polygalacturonase
MFHMNRRQVISHSLAVLALPTAGFAKTRMKAAGTPVSTRLLQLNVRDFGAVGDGKTNDTAVLQQALDRCWALGGGEVLVPTGTYLTGALALRSNTLLRLQENAIISGTGDFADYPVTQVRWEGKWIAGRVGLLYAIDASNIGIVGPGRIVGNPALGGRPTAQSPLRHPALIEMIGCRKVRMEDFSTSYQLMWSIHPTNCEDVTIRGLTIRSTGGNGDGIDLDSCRGVRIENCDIATGDDCIAIKSGRGSEAYQLLQTCEDIIISRCTLADSIFACIGIGSESSGGVRNVRIEHCKFTAAKTYAVYIKSRIGRGAFVEDIIADDLDVSGTGAGFLRINLLSSGIQDENPVPGDAGIPAARNFRFSNVHVKDCPRLLDGTGIHPQKPLDGFSLVNVTGECRTGISLANIRHAEIRNIQVTGYSGPLLAIHNVTGKGLRGAVGIDGPQLPEVTPVPPEPYRLR